ncbi:MAG: hypothetical protein K2O18_06230 [Oscillospiraceae bacterium]|nr:hypothetical protein [Oscillospiraceae bacterium]
MIAVLCAGLTYGFTPCAPLLLMIGYSFTLPVALAGATGVAFSLASMASPVLLTVITGTLSKKMRQKILECIKWFQLVSYLLLIVMSFVITILTSTKICQKEKATVLYKNFYSGLAVNLLTCKYT